MKTLIIPDIHNKVHWIEPFLEKHTVDEIVFLGDYFDDFGDDATDAAKTADWLKHSLSQANRVHLLGNHDLEYIACPVDQNGRARVGWMYCPGNTPNKRKAIRKILTPKERGKFKLLHETQGFFLSHAGIHEDVFAHPLVGYEHLHRDCFMALQHAFQGIYNPILRAGAARGSPQQVVSGILWLDWNYEFVPIEGISQIVGHTPDFDRTVREKSAPGSTNFCIDTQRRCVGFLEDGQFSTIEI